MTLNLLPGPEGWLLHACEGEEVEPLSPFPLTGPMMWRWSDDRTHVVAVDQARKRVTTFRLEGETFERTMSPSTLPKGVQAHCVAMKGAQPYVGASSVWVPRGAREWAQIPMPEFARGDGKRLDGLLVDGDRLVAVDDLMWPKYNLTYDISDAATPVYVASRELRAHITYERIYSVAGGARWFITLSRGINHGNQAAFCTVFDLETLRQAWAYRFDMVFAGVRHGVTLRKAVFLGDLLCLLVDEGARAVLHWVDLADAVLPPVHKPTPRSRRKRLSEMSDAEREAYRRARPKRPPRPAMWDAPVDGLARVDHVSACGSGEGLYLVGVDEAGERTICWEPRSSPPPVSEDADEG